MRSVPTSGHGTQVPLTSPALAESHQTELCHSPHGPEIPGFIFSVPERAGSSDSCILSALGPKSRDKQPALDMQSMCCNRSPSFAFQTNTGSLHVSLPCPTFLPAQTPRGRAWTFPLGAGWSQLGVPEFKLHVGFVGNAAPNFGKGRAGRGGDFYFI